MGLFGGGGGDNGDVDTLRREVEALKTLARQGQAISAIKLLREESGMGLKEAKDVDDGLD